MSVYPPKSVRRKTTSGTQGQRGAFAISDPDRTPRIMRIPPRSPGQVRNQNPRTKQNQSHVIHPQRPPAIHGASQLTCRWKNPYELKSQAMDSGIGSGNDAPVRRMVMPTTFIAFRRWSLPGLGVVCVGWGFVGFGWVGSRLCDFSRVYLT